MNRTYSLEELAASVQVWCNEHQIAPANGQAADEISERTIRYYRTLGLLDAPQGSYLKTFSEKHRLQLIAIRLHQAQGLPLRRIRDELYGKSEAELKGYVARGARQGAKLPSQFTPGPTPETWAVTPLTDDLLIISRQGRSLPQGLIQKLKQVLAEPAQTADLIHN